MIGYNTHHLRGTLFFDLNTRVSLPHSHHFFASILSTFLSNLDFLLQPLHFYTSSIDRLDQAVFGKKIED